MQTMQKQILLGFIASLGVSFLAGCSSDSPATTPEQKKAFAGGPMPADFRAKWAAQQEQNAKSTAANADKMRSTGGGK
jgi:hypothetical protein